MQGNRKERVLGRWNSLKTFCIGLRRQKRPFRSLVVLAAVIPVLSGCPSWVQTSLYSDYRPKPLVDKTGDKHSLADDNSFGSLVNALEKAQYLSPSCFVTKSGAYPVGGGADKPVSASAPVAELPCRTQRDYIVAVLVSKSDDTCQAHKATIFGNEASWNVTLGTLTNAFTGTAAVVGGPVGKSIFSALGLFSNAERSLVNEEVYQNLLVPAIGQKIDELRSTKLTQINSNTKSDVDAYPMYQAISDVMEYHNDCSFMVGLQAALKDGTSGGVSTQYNALLRAEQSLSSQIDNRKSAIRGMTTYNGWTEDKLQPIFQKDPLIITLTSRLQNVEDQLKVVETLPSSKTGSGS